MKSVLNHVAILVENIETTLDNNLFSSSVLGEIEEFESEGTRELYIGLNNQMGRLLLMQAIGDGPYKHALNKRGPGLHHIALDVLNIDEFVVGLTGSGWLLHPRSIEFYKSQRLVFLSRPGTPCLVEVQERKKLQDSDYFIEELKFPFGDKRLLESLNCSKLKMFDDIQLTIDGDFLSVKESLIV